jgi:hypothetical protein
MCVQRRLVPLAGASPLAAAPRPAAAPRLALAPRLACAPRLALALALAATAALAAGGCGSSSKRSSSQPASSGATPGPAPLAAEAQSAATGDIPDNQVFLTFRDVTAGYRMVYPEGWAQRGAGGDVTFQDKNNLIHVTVTRGSLPSAAAATTQLRAAGAGAVQTAAATALTIGGAPALKLGYSTLSQPNPVTGKRVQLLVDRYLIAHAGRLAVLDLGTPRGVDNVDAYRMISRSFRWR